MEIPKKLRIGSVDYKVKLESLSAQGIDGDIDFRLQTIRINPYLADDYTNIIMWHEIVHAIFESLGTLPQEHDEKLVDQLAHALYGVMRDNGKAIMGGNDADNSKNYRKPKAIREKPTQK